MRGITPTPCNGALYAGLTAEEQMAKLTEEFAEAVIAFRNYKRNLQEAKEGEARTGASKRREEFLAVNKRTIALELTDIKTACETALSVLGYDKQARDGLQMCINARNAWRDDGARILPRKQQGYYQGKDGKDVFYIAENWGLNFARANAIKYIIRAGRKTKDEREDFRKAIQCLQLLLLDKLEEEHEG